MNCSKNHISLIHISLVCLALIFLFWMWPPCANAVSSSDYAFSGEGTKENPYLIVTADDLKCLRDLVNQGHRFQDTWFLQVNDIDLENEPWTPIGLKKGGNYFLGYYNGGGHNIQNITASGSGYNSRFGLFDVLGGTVFNLGIESGSFTGRNCASIAVECIYDNHHAYIINCYSKVSLFGVYCGGIAGDFKDGLVINCWSECPVNGSKKIAPTVSSSGFSVHCAGGSSGKSDDTVSLRCFPSPCDAMSVSQEDSVVVSLSCAGGIPWDMIIPWEWNGTCLQFSTRQVNGHEITFSGSGTKDDPYLIGSFSDLVLLRDLVNTGTEFEDCFFLQTEDINMKGSWTPIGLVGSKYGFKGNYNGNGRCISGLRCIRQGSTLLDDNGLFGQLGGVVYNLSVTHARITGRNSGIIASNSFGQLRTMAIINCYAHGSVVADSPAGIVNVFPNGLIAGCISEADLSYTFDRSQTNTGFKVRNKITPNGGITAYSSDTKVYACHSFGNPVMPDAFRSKTSYAITKEHDYYPEAFLLRENIRLALIQQLFGNTYQAELLQLLSLDEGKAVYGGTAIIDALSALNEYGIVIFTGLLMIFLFFFLRKKSTQEAKKYYFSLFVIFGVLCLFMDCAALGAARNSISFGRLLFMAQAHIIAVVSFIRWFRGFRKNYHFCLDWPVLAGCILIIAAALLQFRSVPRYDSSLYYGSLFRGVTLYRLDPLTFVGAFVCWKWAQGAALLIAPLEFLFSGRAIGFYISNLIIYLITFLLFYRLIQELIPNITKWSALFSSLILVFCPYQMGMFPYLCFDSLCVCFAVWLLYAYYRKNTLMVSFCGFLLFFTKISGGVFYVIFLIFAAVGEVLRAKDGSVFHRIFHWWKWDRVLAWILPGVLYLFTLLWGEWLTIQHFNGANLVDPIALKPAVSYLNTVLQSFVFGFRWVIAAAVLAVLIKVFLVSGLAEENRIMTEESRWICFAVIMACLSVFILLLVYNSDAECPRYTSLQNIALTIVFVICILYLFHDTRVRNALLCLMSLLFIIQTFWSIDPMITKTRSSIDTGTKNLYKLASDDDIRPGMNIGGYYGSVGDIYAYNIEYNYYNRLLNDLMRQIQPDKADMFYLLGVVNYEFHLSGGQYPIYWDTDNLRFSYSMTPDSILVKNQLIQVKEMEAAVYRRDGSLPEKFYIIIPPRVYEEDIDHMLEIISRDYECPEKYHSSSPYGSLEIYGFKRNTTV